jgi:hypothetical protein
MFFFISLSFDSKAGFFVLILPGVVILSILFPDPLPAASG